MSITLSVPLAVVQSIVGHSTVEMTRHYFHEQEGALVSAVAALPDVTADASETAQGAGDGAGCADVLPDGAEGVEGRFRAVCAILDGMDADGLRRVRVEIERRLKA